LGVLCRVRGTANFRGTFIHNVGHTTY
jgi:hypothetical protein